MINTREFIMACIIGLLLSLSGWLYFGPIDESEIKIINNHEYIVYRSTIIHSESCPHKKHLGFL